MANFTPQEIEEMLQAFFNTVGKRQYIGARYVPIFGRKGESSIEWDNSSPYEPLTIVLHQGNSYTSRTYVPAGVDITDTNYWVQTGNYSAQIEEYRSEVQNVMHEVDELSRTVADIPSFINSEDNKIKELLPSNAFNNSDNTVKKYVDRVITELSALLPSGRFSDTNTVYNVIYQIVDRYATPVPSGEYSKFGTAGQVLRTNGDGTTQWVDPNLPSEQAMAQAIADWLTAHPEATTTVEDNSITTAKIKNGAVTSEKLSNALRDELLNETIYYDTLSNEDTSGSWGTSGTWIITGKEYAANDHISAVIMETTATAAVEITLSFWEYGDGETTRIQIVDTQTFMITPENGYLYIPYDYYVENAGMLGFKQYQEALTVVSEEDAHIILVGNSYAVAPSTNYALAPRMRVVRYENSDELVNALLYKTESIYEKKISASDFGAYVDDTKQYIIKKMIPAGTKLKKLSLPVAYNNTFDITITLWNISGTTATRYYANTFTVSSECYFANIPFEREIIEDSYLGITVETANVVLCRAKLTGEGDGMYYVSLNTTSGTINDLSYWILFNIEVDDALLYKIEADDLAMDILESQGVYHVGPNLQYTQIQQVLDSVSDDNITIILHPSNTPYTRFSTMRALNESYPWSGLANVKNISIIGLDKARCIVQDNSGQYETPPAEIACNGIIKNITFIATHTDGTFVSGAPSYAVHVDNRPSDITGMNLRFEDCIFISYQSSPLGIGIYRNQHVIFKNCEFYNRTPQDYSAYTDYPQTYNQLGALIMHTAMGYDSGNMSLECYDNVMITENNRYAITLRETDVTPTCILKFINNTLWNDAQANAEVNWEGGGYASFIQAPYNRLNTSSDLNKL